MKKFLSEFSFGIGFLLFLALLKTIVASFYLIDSSSMLPNIIPGDRVFTSKLAYGLWLPFAHHSIFNWSTPKRGDVIVFEAPGKKDTYIKRVIGLPGDVITFKEGVLILNNNPVHEPEILMSTDSPERTFFEYRRFVVPPHAVFVLGDNRDNSEDSRDFGYVNQRAIYGKALFILFSTTGSTNLLPEFRGERFLKGLGRI